MDLPREELRARRLERLTSPRFWKRLVWLVLLLSLIPMLCLAVYDHSCADDYSYSIATHLAWAESHSLWSVLKTALWEAGATYGSWQGTYAAIFLFSLQPGIFGDAFYAVTPLILLASLLLSTLCLFRVLCGRLLGEKDLGDLIAGTLLLLQIHLLPSPVQGLYWWNGASYYGLFHCLMLLQCALLAGLLLERKRAWPRVALGCLLGLLLGGGNYVSALLSTEMALLFLLLSLLRRRDRAGFALISAATLAGFLTSALAPGNAVRQSYFVRGSALGSILRSYREAAGFALSWTSMPLVLLALLFLAPFLWRLCREKLPRGLRLLPAAGLLALLFSAFASSFAPTVFAMGNEGELRVQNIRFYLWCILCVFGEAAIIAALQGLLANKRLPSPSRLRAWTAAYLTAVVIGAGATAAFYVASGNWNRLSGASAAGALLGGAASQYDAEAEARLALLRSGEKRVELPAFTVRPYLLYYDDIQEVSWGWQNQALAEYYGLEEVVLRPAGQ